MKLAATLLVLCGVGCGLGEDAGNALDKSYDVLANICPDGFIYDGTGCVPASCPDGFIREGNACVADANAGLCVAGLACFELPGGDGVCATASGEIPAGAPSCDTQDCAADQLCITATGVEGDFCLDVCDPDLGPEEPKPEFTVGSASGQIAIDDDGIRTYIYDGEEYLSTLQVSLREVGSEDSCSIVLDPAFVSFGTRNTNTRTFATVTMDLGASIVLQDNCGWDDDYMLGELESSFVTVGFTRARFEEDRPYLDVYYPETSTTVVSGGLAFAIDEDGVLYEEQTVEPTGGVFIPGVYQW
jgi:hypothetical protein